MFEDLDPNDPVPPTELYLGSDESLKGDTFGGLVVSGVLLNQEGRDTLAAMGIVDSKKIDDKHISLLASKVREVALAHHTVSLLPEEYNQYDSKGLLNRYHQEVSRVCRSQIDQENIKIIHVVDKYPGAIVGDIIETKAESKYVEVAAASILAREAALKQFDELKVRAGREIPKGSTHVSDALEWLKQSGRDPKEYVKVHFKNVRAALFSP